MAGMQRLAMCLLSLSVGIAWLLMSNYAFLCVCPCDASQLWDGGRCVTLGGRHDRPTPVMKQCHVSHFKHLSGPNRYALTQIFQKNPDRSILPGHEWPFIFCLLSLRIHRDESWFVTIILAHMLDSLVRVSRRADEIRRTPTSWARWRGLQPMIVQPPEAGTFTDTI